jgi:hypothetical protein
MQKFIAKANIARFEALIAGEPDDAKRQLLEQMLDREKAALNGLGVANGAAAGTGEHRASTSDAQSPRGNDERPTG